MKFHALNRASVSIAFIDRLRYVTGDRGVIRNGAKLLRVMKLTAFIILFACLQTSATGVAQQTITYSGREVSLENVFAAIKKQTNYKFFFNTESLRQAQRITIEVKNASIEQVMSMVLKDQPFTFTIKGRTIFIIKKVEEIKTSLQTAPVPVTGDPVTVSGKVTDDKGNPLPGANVKVKGTNIGTTTDNQGMFKLSNLSEDAVLIISFVGHDPQTVLVKGKSFFTIALGQKLAELDETVVIAYGTTTRRFTTGNIASVKAADIEKAPVQNPLLALQGRVPGIEITQLTGMPGGGITVRVQGINSIRSGLDPLIVINGVPYPTQLTSSTVDVEAFIVRGGNPLNYINPADIESIEILKDADATSIYGSRAANGAILITTKTGKAGRTKINLNLQQGWGRVTRKANMMDTRQYLDMRYEAFRNNGILWTSPSISADDLKIWDTTRYTDWQKVLIGGTAKYTNVNASISGGSQIMQYLIGATYKRQTTVFPGQFDDKVGSVHCNVNSATADQRLKVQFTGSYSYDQNHLPGLDLTQTAVLMEPNAPELYKGDGTLNWAPDPAGNSTWTNPLSYTVSSDFNNTTKNLVSNANLIFKIFKELELHASGGYTNTQSQIYVPTRLESFRPELRINAQRTAIFANRNMSSWIIEPQLQYTKKIGKGRLEGLLGVTIQQNGFSYLSILGSGFHSDLLMKTLTAARTLSIRQSTSGFTRYNAIFGRLNYIFENKYMLNLTTRRDGSNNFGDKNKFNNFGSIGLGWIFSEEKWIRGNLPFLSFGKLRGSYGITGNDQISNFSYLTTYSVNNPSILYQNSIGLNALNIPNPYLQWEKTVKSQGGIDLGILHDRIMLSVTYARNRSSNQLIGYLLPSVTGFNLITKNLPATIQNTSCEFLLNTVNVKTQNFNWSGSVNVTIPRNKLINFPGIESTSYADGTLGIAIGQPLSVLKVFQYTGLNPANGRHMVTDKNGNPTANFSSGIQNMYVSKLSTYYGGIVNNIRYKGFQVDFLIQFVRKKGPRDLFWYNGLVYPGVFSRGVSNQSVSVLSRWQKPGDDAISPPFSTTTYSLTVNSSDAYYSYDASYIRLKNVSVSWQLPASWLQKAHLQNGQVYFRGQNLVTITNYTGLDPETETSGFLPPLQMWTVGASLDL